MSIQRTLLSSFATVLLIMVAVGLVATVRLLHTELHESQDTKARIVAQNLGVACADPLLLGELDRLHAILRSLRESDPNVSVAWITDGSGRCVAATEEARINQVYSINDDAGPDAEGAAAQLHLGADGLLEARAPVVQGRDRLGNVHIAYSSRTIDEAVRAATWAILAGAGGSFAVCLTLYLLIINRTAVRTLKQFAAELIKSASSVDQAVLELGHISQVLSAATTETAGALRVSATTLEDLGKVSEANRSRAGETKEIAAQSLQSADAGAASMRELEASMQTLQASSREVEKIVKTIDEIAFQTNLLALNAAVEAARAGSAGAGFAVVADEVRALAQRATDAARETATRIADAVKHSHLSASLSQQVAQNLGEIATRARAVDALVGQIASTSRDQAAGILQLGEVIHNLDATTHTNSKLGEDCATAANGLAARTDAINALASQAHAMTRWRKTASAPAPCSSAAPALSGAADRPASTNGAAPSAPPLAASVAPATSAPPGGAATPTPSAVVPGFEEF